MLTDFYRQLTLKMSPFPLYILVEVICSGMKELIGTAQKIFMGSFHNGICDGYFSKSEFMRVGYTIVNKIQNDPDFINKIKENFEKEIPVLLDTAENANKVTETTSNEELNAIFQKYYQQYNKAYPFACIPFLADFSLEENGKKLLAQKTPDFMEQQKCLSSFAFPTGKSWDTKEKLELIEIYKSGENINEKLEQHWTKWRWLAYDFEGEELSKEYFKMEFKKITDENILKLEEQEKEAVRNKELQQEFISKLQLNETEQRVLRALGELAYFKEYRKGLFTKTHYLIEPLLIEIGKRGNLSLEEVRFLWPTEIKELLKGKDFKENAKERKQFSVYVQEEDRRTIYVGEKAKQFLNKHYKEEINEDATEIKGNIASMGIAKGKVKIIMTVKDMAKMEKGDILVSAMTNPDLMPAIVKAVAIVTDTGGLTCHAAIVSRELNTPCIIGTDHATKILKDGDLVEVDANKGIVKILKKAK